MDYAATLRTRLFWAGSAMFALIGAGSVLYGPALPAFARVFGTGLAEAGLLISVHNLGALAALLASAALGPLSARQALGVYGAGALAIALAAGFAAGHAAGFAAALLGAGGLGAGHGLIAVVVNRRFLTESGANGAAMVGVVNAVFGLGAIAGPLVFLALGARPDLAYGLVAAASALLVPLAGTTPTQGGPSLLGLRLGLRRARARLLLGGAAIGIEVTLIGLGPAALVARGLGEAEAARLASAFFAAFLSARFGMIWLAPRLGAMTLLALAFAATGAAVLAAALLPPAAPFVAAGAAAGLFFPAMFVAVSERLGTDGRAAAIAMAAGALGAILCPALGAALIAVSGAAALFPALGVLSAALALATLAAGRAA